MKISSFETIIDEAKFLEANQRSAKGRPDSWETIAAKERLKKYHAAKGQQIPEEIKDLITQTIEKHAIHNQESPVKE